jgi:hypothetical protein
VGQWWVTELSLMGQKVVLKNWTELKTPPHLAGGGVD